MLLASLTPSEVLHLVEFYLEDGITDDEAVALIDLEAPRLNKAKNKWQEMMSDRILLIRIGFQSFSYGEKRNNFEFISPVMFKIFVIWLMWLELHYGSFLSQYNNQSDVLTKSNTFIKLFHQDGLFLIMWNV